MPNSTGKKSKVKGKIKRIMKTQVQVGAKLQERQVEICKSLLALTRGKFNLLNERRGKIRLLN
jgi:hypothetical protein